MGSVLSSDSGKSAPASATRRGLERRGSPALPVTSFDCSVCLEVLHQPVRTRCGHVFCRSCIATSLKNNKWTCPYCRAYLPSEGVPATDVAKRMKSEYRNCTECDTLVCLSEMRAHIRTCQKYIDNYGPLRELGETRFLVQSTSLGEQEVTAIIENEQNLSRLRIVPRNLRHHCPLNNAGHICNLKFSSSHIKKK
ncbi:E3 ubiquitin-protein ligase RNF125 isoform 3-T3 [Trichechus inunguis]